MAAWAPIFELKSRYRSRKKFEPLLESPVGIRPYMSDTGNKTLAYEFASKAWFSLHPAQVLTQTGFGIT